MCIRRRVCGGGTAGRWSTVGGRARYYPPIAAPPVVISARFLSEDERVLIGDLLRTGQSIRSIAVRLGRSPSTISREVRRNATDVGNYRPFTAHRMALARRPRPRPGKLAHDKPLRDFVQGKLKLHWSPEQICHALPSEFPGQRKGTWCTKPSTRPSTCKDAVNCAAN